MKTILPLLLTALALLADGCAVIRQRAAVESLGTNGVVEIRTTAGKTASTGASGVEQEASTANLAADLNALANMLKALRPAPAPVP
jgi:hypothetical protein